MLGLAGTLSAASEACRGEPLTPLGRMEETLKAREWLERGDAAGDAFDALSNYWRGFNNLFAGQGQERQLISDFLKSKFDEQYAQNLLEAHVKEASDLLSTPVIDMRGNGKDTSQFIAQFSAAPTALEKLDALFMVIYQVRCNFEHGQKSPSRDRDKTLCEAACPFVSEVVRRAAPSIEGMSLGKTAAASHSKR